MTLNEQYESVKKAVINRELKHLFLGEGAYNWGGLSHIPADVPADIAAILKYGLYRLAQEQQFDIPAILTDAIVELLGGKAVEVWTAYSIVWYQYRYELTRLSPFKIVNQELLTCVRDSIKANEDSLSRCDAYVGKIGDNGLLGDILASNRSFQKKFEVSIL